MKVAIVFTDSQVSQHYGKSEGFIIYELDENKQVISTETILNGGIKGCEMATLFNSYEVKTVIVGEIGMNAKRNLDEHGIKVILGAEGNISNVLKKYCNNSLKLKDIKPHEHNRKDCHH